MYPVSPAKAMTVVKNLESGFLTETAFATIQWRIYNDCLKGATE
jgi:hypothetical protein